ncbi:MAG: alpha/beta hydrolase, partial [Anaerolineae bacterium]
MNQQILDRPEVLQVLFHPRSEGAWDRALSDARRVVFPIEAGIHLGGRLYPAGPAAPCILYFHGNGEIAADYDGLAPLYNRLGITLLVVDYRGYGTSAGVPTATHLLADAVAVFDELDSLLADEGLMPARLYVMGRSLGSAAAIEVAWRAGERLAGLIIESGFADTFALLARLGLRVEGVDEARDGFGNVAKIAGISMPTLIIHGKNDVLIPAADKDHRQLRVLAD